MKKLIKWMVGYLLLSLVACSCAFSSRRTDTAPPLESPPPPHASPSVSPNAGPAAPPTRPNSSPSKKQPDLAVRQMQGILHEYGYDPGPLDGLMGDKTRAALRQFQLDHQLPETGRIDPATKAALFQ